MQTLIYFVLIFAWDTSDGVHHSSLFAYNTLSACQDDFNNTKVKPEYLHPTGRCQEMQLKINENTRKIAVVFP